MRFEDAHEIVRSQQALEALWTTDLIGLGVGRKDQGPITGSGQFCVTTFVARKLPRSQLPTELDAQSIVRRIAQAVLRRELEPADIDVVEVGDDFRAHSYSGSSHGSPAGTNTQKWFESLRPGIGVCTPALGYPAALDSGTISFFIEFNGETYLVSCNHVIAGAVETLPNSNYVVIQPASEDLNGHDINSLPAATDVERAFGVADLTHIVPLRMHTPGAPKQPINFADAAAAKLRGPRDVSALNRLPYGGKTAGKASGAYTRDPKTGEVTGTSTVYKVGRTSGYTEGIVTTVVTSVVVTYPAGKATFANCLSIKPTHDNTGRFSLGGDSGSPLLTETHQIAGMVFSGGPTRSLAVQIDDLVGQLTSAMTQGGIGGAITVL